MIYYKSSIHSMDDLNFICDDIRSKASLIQNYNTQEIINELSRIFEENKKLFVEVFKDKNALNELLSKKNLSYKILSELGGISETDHFKRSAKGNYFEKYQALGIVLNISASNVDLGVLDNLINFLLTKNFGLIKLSQSNNYLLNFFKEIFKNSFLKDCFALFVFKGGSVNIENILVNTSDALLLWGGEEVISNYRERYPLKKIISHGPRLSFSIVDCDHHLDLDCLVEDFTRWNQKACSNTQVLFVFNSKNNTEFIKKLSENIKLNNIELFIEDNEAVEKLKELEYARYQKFLGGYYAYKSDSYLIYEDVEKNFKSTSLNNSLKIIFLENEKELLNLISPYKSYFQSVSLNIEGAKRKNITTQLARLGVSRFTRIGDITNGVKGMPHEGEYALKELINIVIDQHFDLVDESGFSYASGGTTGEPKIKNYSYGEFNHIALKLANTYNQYIHSYKDIIANLFMSGGMWSSYNVIQKALEYVNVMQLPLGSALDQESLRYYLFRLRPNIVFAIPSMLYNFALYLENRDESLDLSYIFFAGEKLTKTHEELFKKIFHNPIIRSAGYATVDFGLIGYQDHDHERDEFNLFEDMDYKIVEDELLVKTNHMDSYFHTGDKVKQLCNGFKLEGRIDKLINIWGARINLSSLQKFFPNSQVILFTESDKEIMKLNTQIFVDEEVIKNFYSSSYDLKNTVTNYKEFRSKFRVVKESLILSERTGKYLVLLDNR